MVNTPPNPWNGKLDDMNKVNSSLVFSNLCEKKSNYDSKTPRINVKDSHDLSASVIK